MCLLGCFLGCQSVPAEPTNPGGDACAPGSTSACACTDGSMSYRVCLQDGRSQSDCFCRAGELDMSVVPSDDLAMRDAATRDAALRPDLSAPPDQSCVPDCAARSCGKDPRCGASCGSCSASQVCQEKTASAQCVAPTIRWEVDGSVVHMYGSAEAYYYVSMDLLVLFFPHWGRNIQISVSKLSTKSPGTLVSCPTAPDPTTAFTLITSDNGWAGLSALPMKWKNLSFGGCGKAGSGDQVSARGLSFTQLSASRVAGSYEFLIQGDGLRAGSTLRVSGSFDEVPVSM